MVLYLVTRVEKGLYLGAFLIDPVGLDGRRCQKAYPQDGSWPSPIDAVRPVSCAHSVGGGADLDVGARLRR